MLASEQTLMIGCGTGRCGTKSLAQLIDRCLDANCTHERRPLLPWLISDRLLCQRVAQLTAESSSIVGDVAPSYLPYLDRLLETIPRLKVVCMERCREAVIASFLDKTPWQHHWYEHDGTEWLKDDIWDPVFPKYAVADKALALGMYWDDYHQRIRQVAQRYPTRVGIFDIDSFNSSAGQDEIYDFLAIPKVQRHYPSQHHYNAAPVPDKVITSEGLRQWTQDLKQCGRELESVIPPDASLILVDQDMFGTLVAAGRQMIPFLEKDGRYWGCPQDSNSAISELERLRQAGAGFIAFAWPAFWWLDYYVEFHHYLRSRFACMLQNDRLIVFNLSNQRKLSVSLNDHLKVSSCVVAKPGAAS